MIPLVLRTCVAAFLTLNKEKSLTNFVHFLYQTTTTLQ